MAIQSQTVAQYAGFGNDEQQSLSEYYFGRGTRNAGAGLTFSPYLSPFFTSSDYSDIGTITRFARADGLGGYGSTGGKNVSAKMLFLGETASSNVFQSYLGVFTPEHIYRFMNINWHAAGMIADPKGRMLFVGWQYLGMFDAATSGGNYVTGTVAVTNGSANVVGTGTTFTSGDVGRVFRIDGDTGTSSFYRIATYTDATHITLATNYTGTTGSGKGYTIFRAWTEQWKDFGTSISNMADGSSVLFPTENYEDTVLIGRRNNICTLNVTTDTITDDSSPAFNMPSGYDNVSIKGNTNGILMGFNRNGKGTLVLWDNYSDRSIAPWIPLNDLILGIAPYSSGWLVMTARGIYYTNGYSIEPFLEKFLETTVSAYGGVTESAFQVIGEELLFGLAGTLSRVRGGLYRLNLKTKLAEHVGSLSGLLYGASINALFYDPTFGRTYMSDGGGVSFISDNNASSSKTYYYISSDVGVGENTKIAEQIRLPIKLTHFDSQKKNITFNLECRVNNLDRQLHNEGQVKSNSGNNTTLTVDETTWPPAQVGDVVEFVTGSNKGLVRGITAISAGGTNAAVYTLDSALTANPATNDLFIWSGFKPVEKKTITAASGITDLYFGIKNKYRGKHFKVMFIVTGASLPVTIMPFEFQYDDMGILE